MSRDDLGEAGERELANQQNRYEMPASRYAEVQRLFAGTGSNDNLGAAGQAEAEAAAAELTIVPCPTYTLQPDHPLLTTIPRDDLGAEGEAALQALGL